MMASLRAERRKFRRIQKASRRIQKRAYEPKIDQKNPFREEMQLRDMRELKSLNSNPQLHKTQIPGNGDRNFHSKNPLLASIKGAARRRKKITPEREPQTVFFNIICFLSAKGPN